MFFFMPVNFFPSLYSGANQSEDEDKPVRTQPRQSRSMRIIQKSKAPAQESAVEVGCTDF